MNTKKITELKALRLAAAADKATAEAKIAAIDAQLLLIIPRGEEAEGITHYFKEDQAYPSWKSIAEMLMSKFIPKAKAQAAQKAIEKSISATEKPVEYIRVGK